MPLLAVNISNNLDASEQKNSLTAIRGLPQSLAVQFQRPQELFDFFQHLGIERIVDPTALASVCEHAGIFQCLEVKGQT